MLEVGKKIPAFNLEAPDGSLFSYKNIKNKFAVIVFYPANNTPG